MTTRRILMVLVPVALVAVFAVTGWAGDVAEALDQMPTKARAALVKLAGTATIVEAEQEKEHGVVCYEAEWAVDGREVGATVTADGELVEMEEELDEASVPAAIQAAATKALPAGTAVEYERVTTVVYEVEAKVDGKEKEMLISATGKIMKRGRWEKDDDEGDDDDDDADEEDEVAVAFDQLPAAVKATILAEADGATIKEIERETAKNGQMVYEAEWVEGGQEIEVKVAADGTLLKRVAEDADDDDDDDDDK
ncbi:MAG: PepSY-like domain-containing protein [Phycisphaerae bacterium]|nr:PepSY-like domain-containing protein [Phycisphaerae bacterium]